MEKKIILNFSIDVEPDSSDNWNYRTPLSFKGIEEGIFRRLQPLFEKYRAKPTYLINNVVLERYPMDGFLSLSAKVELGTHLHPEFIKPKLLFPDPAGKRGRFNQCFLDPEVEFEKLKNITELFKEKTGLQPTAFRAGRFAIHSNTLECLSNLGYKVDTSVTPGIRWKDVTRIKPLDFRFTPRQPYHPSLKNISKKGNSSILEIPVSIDGFWPFKRYWLRPGWTSSITSVTKKILKRNKKNTAVVLNCMFHNVDVVEGLSPHCGTRKDSARILSELEQLIVWALKNNAEFATLSETAEFFRK